MKRLVPGIYMDKDGRFCAIAEPVKIGENTNCYESNGSVYMIPTREEDSDALREAVFAAEVEDGGLFLGEIELKDDLAAALGILKK